MTALKQQRKKLIFINLTISQLLDDEWRGGELDFVDTFVEIMDWGAEAFGMDKSRLAKQILNIYELVK